MNSFVSKVSLRAQARALALVAVVAASTLLAACGGGDDTVAPPPALRFSNASPPAGTNPLAGAENLYHRSSDGSRHSPFDIEITLFNAAGDNITEAKREVLMKAYKDIYLWKYPEWDAALTALPAADKSVILRGKANAFWETSAQQFAERVFGVGNSRPAFKFGPACAFTVCAVDKEVIPEAAAITVKTTVQGERDPLNPVTRSITFSAKKASLENPDVLVELILPAGISIASPQQEVLDFRPSVAGSRTAYKEMKIVATINAASKKRVIGFDYPDFNLVFVPLRHMVFQGDVLNPKGPQSSLTYATEAALLEKFQSTVQQMYSPTGAVTLAESLKAFVNEKYYYMNGAGVTGYAGYILGSGAGVAKGLKPDVTSIDLFLDGRKAISVSQ